MKREFLTNMGLEKEQVDKIMAEHGKSTNKLQEEKENAEQKAQEVDDLKQQITDRDQQLTDLQKKAKDNKELTDEIDRLKQENENSTQELQQKLEQQEFNFKLEKELSGAKARDVRAVKPFLDMESIKLKDGEFEGLKDQLDKVKEEHGYLFEEEQQTGKPSFSQGQHNTGGPNEPSSLRDALAQRFSQK